MSNEIDKLKGPEVAKHRGLQGTRRSTLLDMGADFGYEVVMSEWEDKTIHAIVLPRPGSTTKRQKVMLTLVGDMWFIDEIRIEGLPTEGGMTKTFPEYDRPRPDAMFIATFLRPIRQLFSDGVRVARKEGTDVVIEIEGQQEQEHLGTRLAIER